MSFLLALVAAIGAVGALLWRINMAADATRGLADTAQDLAGLKRRWQWGRRANVNPLTLVDDPRMAAVALMTAIAQADGAMTAAERTAIMRQAMEHFSCTSKIAEEMLSYARFLVGDTRDPANVFLKLQPLIVKSCAEKERGDLIAMLRAVAAADGPAADNERAAIDQMERDLG